MATLITAALSAKAYQIKNLITQGEILLGDYNALPDIMVATGKMIKLPNPVNAAYIHEMLTLCLDKNISVIYPLQQAEQHLLKEAMLLFSEYGINFYFIADALQ